MNEEEKRKYEAFQYWIQTNTERGVTTIPDNLCLFVVNLIKSLQKENEELKGQYAEYVKLTCNEVAKNSELNSESNSAIKEKNKIINAMSKYIAKLDIDEDICKKMGIFQDCEIKDVENCKKCIIEYFKNKMRQKCDTATTEK